MEAQLHRNHGRDYDDPADVHVQEERGGSAMKKVKEKLKATIHGGHHKDEAQAVNDSHVVRSGLAEPTVMGTPVLAEDLYTTRHSDIAEDEERHNAPPPLSTELPHHTYGVDVNRDQLKSDVGGLNNEGYGEPPPLSTGFGGHSADVGHGVNEDREQLPSSTGYEAHLPDQLPHDTGGQEVGITGVLKSLDKMKLFDEHDTSYQHEPNVHTGSHDQFAPEPVENPPLDTIAANPSNPNSSYTQRISAIAERVAALKDTVVSKLSSSGDNTSDANRVSPKTNKKSSFPTEFSHKVADTLSGTLGPVYEKVAGAGSSVMSKMQSSGDDDTGGKGVTVKEYLVDTFRPGEDDKVLSDVITHALHRGKGNQQQAQETSTTTYVIRDEGERRLQDN